MSKDTIISTLQELKNESLIILSTKYDTGFGYYCVTSGSFNPWRAKILTTIDTLGINIPEIRSQIAALGAKHLGPSCVSEVTGYIDTIIDLLNHDFISYGNNGKPDMDSELALVFDRFHKVARQLRTRHDNRETLQIKDEYDVQDLLHALLLVHFDDVRPEEWTPSYAGSSLRMDFLLKDCQTVIEVKKTRPSMTAKELGEELIIDIEKYQAHPDCKTLYCFVYDPEGHLGNPEGIKKDLEAAHKDFVKVFIRPE